MTKIPVYDLSIFRSKHTDFYVNNLKEHLSKHHIVHHPHKHDFFVCVYFVSGRGTHEIDFERFSVKPGTVFFLMPGQVHNWKLSDDADGYIFFHSRGFHELTFKAHQLEDLPFFSSFYNVPFVQPDEQKLLKVRNYFRSLLDEFESPGTFHQAKIISLVELIYIELARSYAVRHRKQSNLHYLEKTRQVEDLISLNYRKHKSPAYYAEKMNMSGKHLNRILKETLNKTVTEVIADRIILEAKRLMIHSDITVSQVADELGFEDKAYFNRFYKKHQNETPGQFLARYRKA